MSRVQRDSESSSEVCVTSKRRRVIPLPSSGSESSSNSPLRNIETSDLNEWFEPRGNQPNIVSFTSPQGAKLSNEQVQNCKKVEDFYGLYVTESMFEHIAEQTNIYATQSRVDSERCNKWVPTDKNEIKRFFGLILWMGLAKFPSLSLYWSQDPMFGHTFPQKIMCRDRFQILLRMLHFADNTKVDASNRLSKVEFILNELNSNFKKYYDPTEMLCIDESIMPFRGRIVFRQYMKQKRHRYGIKIFKLCCTNNYTYSYRVYTGKTLDKESKTPTNVVLNLCESLFEKGHTLCTDNYYTSVDLANKLISKNMHLIGTLRPNRKENPKAVVTAKLRRGEVIARENRNGITVMKWKDKRDVLVLSTKHSNEMENATTRTGVSWKPKIIIDYNKGKTPIDLSDQMSSYSSPLRRALKWYRKLAFDLLLNTAVVNALHMYQSVTGTKISITMFRKQLVAALTQHSHEQTPVEAGKSRRIHRLREKEGKAHKVRKYCSECYSMNTKMLGRDIAKKNTKKVVTYCDMCQSHPHFCLKCFNKLH
ncbi:PiggyBac transposable element-derived protein 4 [Anthophora retusa]